MSAEKTFKALKPGMSATAQSWRDRRSEKNIGKTNGDRLSNSSWRPKWESEIKPKIFVPSEEPPLGLLLRCLKPDDFHEKAKDANPQSVVTESRTVASYNWLEAAEPTIVIPGKPPRWTPLRKPRQLKPDDGEYFRDFNAAQYPRHPLEPAVVAALALQPDIAQHVDIVACGKTLDNLLNFIRGTDKHFRMLVELVGNSVFFVRRENTAHERLSDVRGYGHSFPEAYTTWDAEVKGSTVHQRVISYHFGGLRFLVRFQGDGYFAGSTEDKEDICEASAPADLDLKQAVDTLSDELAMSRVAPITPAKKGDKLLVTYAGDLIRQARIFELKTRSVRRKEGLGFENTFEDLLPRLWATQIPNFILAYHDHGLFEEVNVKKVDSDIRDWERGQAAVLSRFAALIHHIFSLVKSRPDGKLELRHVVPGELEVRKQLADAGDALSKPARAMWERAKSGSDERLVSDGSDSAAGSGPEHRDWEDEFEPDYTACSADDCGYCGRCSY